MIRRDVENLEKLNLDSSLLSMACVQVDDVFMLLVLLLLLLLKVCRRTYVKISPKNQNGIHFCPINHLFLFSTLCANIISGMFFYDFRTCFFLFLIIFNMIIKFL